jgi:hypothetical protein
LASGGSYAPGSSCCRGHNCRPLAKHKGGIVMKRLLQLLSVLLFIGAAAVLGQNKNEPDAEARAAVIKLFESLTDEQQKLGLKDPDDKDRYAEIFPEVARKGLPLSMLKPEQKALLDDVIKTVCSDYGAGRCLEIAKQTGDKGRYINFYGTPKAGSPFAWRIAQHHLTLIYAEHKDKADEFGPVLLGGNPVKALWDDEEKIALELYAALAPEEAKAIKGKGNGGSGANLDAAAGMKIGDLMEKPRDLARKLLAKRLAVFNADQQKVLEEIIKREGGVDSLRIAFWGEATKSHHDGGKFSWKIGTPLLLCDWQTVGKEHIHMTVRGKAKKT